MSRNLTVIWVRFLRNGAFLRSPLIAKQHPAQLDEGGILFRSPTEQTHLSSIDRHAVVRRPKC